MTVIVVSRSSERPHHASRLCRRPMAMCCLSSCVVVVWFCCVGLCGVFGFVFLPSSLVVLCRGERGGEERREAHRDELFVVEKQTNKQTRRWMGGWGECVSVREEAERGADKHLRHKNGCSLTLLALSFFFLFPFFLFFCFSVSISLGGCSQPRSHRPHTTQSCHV